MPAHDGPAERIGFFFHMGHGHYTQFLNFRDCLPDEYRARTEWVPLRGDSSGHPVTRLPGLPPGLRYRLNQAWHAGQGVRRHSDWRALFFAAETVSLVPLIRRYPSYIYTDLTPSLKRELAPWYDHQLRGNWAFARVREAARRRLFAACEGVFTMSCWAARGVQRDYRVAPDRVHVVLPGANLRRWRFGNRAGRPVHAPVRVLMVGGQFQSKGGPELLEWAQTTRVRGWELDMVTWPGSLPDWVRSALGNPGPSERVSATLAPRLPNVRIHCGMSANSDEILALFAEADLMCLPTHADGSSIATLEAMATGLPVLVGAVGGIPELVRDGETGMLLKREYPDELAVKLERLIGDRDLRFEMGQAARAACDAYYNVDRQIRDILHVMDGGPSTRVMDRAA